MAFSSGNDPFNTPYIDPAALAQLIARPVSRTSRSRSRDPLQRILSGSARSFARSLFQARRSTLEGGLSNLLLGGGGGSRGGAGISSVLSGLVDTALARAFSRTKTNVATAESDRSRFAQSFSRTSDSQQAAMLVTLAKRGERNV